MQLPYPNSESLALSNCLSEIILNEIKSQGPISFAQYMQLALYNPGLGYYSNSLRKFGEEGDFVTAPEISPYFSQCIGRQFVQILANMGGDILEFGSGSGTFAINVLLYLEKNNQLPDRYLIMELSAELKQRQRELFQTNAPHLLNKIIWLDKLPDQFTGIIFGNEVLDAMPVHRFKYTNQRWNEFYVDYENNQFKWCLRQGDKLLLQTLENLNLNLPNDYESEINLLLQPWIKMLSDSLQKGVVILIDYGFPRKEFYHPQRAQGTLMCHYRHRSHSDPFFMPGLQDITSHVDFTAVAEASFAQNLAINGYTTQGNFLLNCGLLGLLENKSEVENYMASQEIKKLTLPSEMGELFKVIALTRHYDQELLGFSSMNQVHRL